MHKLKTERTTKKKKQIPKHLPGDDDIEYYCKYK